MSEQMYTAQQIKIPSDLPDILKQYTKAAIKTQPSDLLLWSMQYFEALSQNAVPPVQSRLALSITETAPQAQAQEQQQEQAQEHAQTLEQSQVQAHAAVSVAQLAALRIEIEDTVDGSSLVSKEIISELTAKHSIPEIAVSDAFAVGEFADPLPWRRFLALLCSSTTKGGVDDSIKSVLSVFSSEDGSINFDLFQDLHTYLVSLDDENNLETYASRIEQLRHSSTLTGGVISLADYEAVTTA
eukprot:m.50478 g.50478  ORF g.50478 m.50478 type:complete len:242 (-) comp48128_c0_seq1:1288-2013(-)